MKQLRFELAGVLFALVGCVTRGEVLMPNDSDAGNTPARAFSISLGDRHGCAVIQGRTFCWGANDFGQLGINSLANQLQPVAVTINARALQVAVGAEHSCNLDDLGVVYCWGANDRGQLGLGDRDLRLVPTAVTLPAPATLVVTKFSHTCALLLDSRLFCWGDNTEGELGQADAFPENDERAADGLLPLAVGDGAWRAVDTGDGHTCGVRNDGELRCWGRNSDHELGADARVQIREPVAVTDENDWLNVTTGQNHTCAIKQDRSSWCWGANSGHATSEGCPLGIDANELASPTRVGAANDWAQIVTNTFHTCGINRSSELYCWGRNTEGQLGLGDTTLRTEPTLTASGITVASTGRFSTCAISTYGSISCAGDNADGQLGTGDNERRNRLSPTEVPK